MSRTCDIPSRAIPALADLHGDKYPQVMLIHHYCRLQLYWTDQLLHYAHVPAGSVDYSDLLFGTFPGGLSDRLIAWFCFVMLLRCRLHQCLGPYFSEEERWSMTRFYNEFSWPRNSKSTAFDSAGFSVFEAIAGFTQLVWFEVFAASVCLGEYTDPETLQIEQYPDPRIIMWKENAREHINKIWPASTWSDNAIIREYNTLNFQLVSEVDQAIKRILISDKPKQACEKEPVETTTNRNETEGDSQISREVAWDDKNPDYMSLSEAIVKFTDNKLSLPTVSKRLKPNGPVRYMRKGRRCRVHVSDFRKDVKDLYPQLAFSSETADEILADYEAKKAAAKRRKELSS